MQQLFEQHQDVKFDGFGKPTLPVSAIPEILRYHAADGADSLLSNEELEGFMNALQSRDKPVDVDTIVQLYAIKTKSTSPIDELDTTPYHDSSGDSPSRPASRESEEGAPPPPSKGFTNESPDSPFEAKNRQRSRPLLPPSSFQTKKPLPAAQSGRRRSDAGSYPLSDSEVPFINTHFGFCINVMSVARAICGGATQEDAFTCSIQSCLSKSCQYTIYVLFPRTSFSL